MLAWTGAEGHGGSVTGEFRKMAARPGTDRRTAALWLVASMAFALCNVAVAQDDESGDFEILEAGLVLRDGTYFLDASARLELSAEAKEALASGLPLSISYRLEFLNRLRLWWDLEAFMVRQRFQIEYHALTERYMVTNVNTGARARFNSLVAALAYVGRIDGLRTVDIADLDDDLRYDVRIRVVLDTERLPGPLRLLAFWRHEWSLASDWETWRLDAE